MAASLSVGWLAVSYPEMAAVRYRLWGIEAERVTLEEGLSPEVARAVAALADELLGVVGSADRA
jgi:hypothetical protein